MTWTSTTESIDKLIRDYLLQRGFNNTLKSFDNDLKNDKEKGFKVSWQLSYTVKQCNFLILISVSALLLSESLLLVSNLLMQYIYIHLQ